MAQVHRFVAGAARIRIRGFEVAAVGVVLVPVRARAHRVRLAVGQEQAASRPVVVTVAFTLSGDFAQRRPRAEVIVSV
ncbi:hypothetical protein ADL26_19535, partial [Thermoactinomyces vulgaris]